MMQEATEALQAALRELEQQGENDKLPVPLVIHIHIQTNQHLHIACTQTFTGTAPPGGTA